MAPPRQPEESLSPADREIYNHLIMSWHSSRAELPDSELAGYLHHGNAAIVRESLGLLTHRKASVDLDFAVALLDSPDLFVWLNAAHYLGVNGRRESIPYLIKTFHADTVAKSVRPDARQYLGLMTDQDFGENFEAWRMWYEATYPQAKMDWEAAMK